MHIQTIDANLRGLIPRPVRQTRAAVDVVGKESHILSAQCNVIFHSFQFDFNLHELLLVCRLCMMILM